MLKEKVIALLHRKYPPVALSALNVLLVLMVIVGNSADQVFCRPVPWFLGVLGVFAISFAAYPLLGSFPVAQKMVLLVSTIFFWIFFFALDFTMYGLKADELTIFSVVWLLIVILPFAGCVALFLWFLLRKNKFNAALFCLIVSVLAAGWMVFNLFLTPIILAFIVLPIVLLIVCLRLRRQWHGAFRWAVVSFHILILAGFIFMMEKYLSVSVKITKAETVDELKAIKDDGPLDAYMLERIMGFHFKYHTRLCLYDGWRPPLLDPLMSMAYISSGAPQPNFALHDFSLHQRIMVYKELFPERPVVEDCKCSPATPDNYYEDLENY